MYRFLALALIGLLIQGCANYENQDRYVLNVGETVKIYYSTNSCCYYCISNRMDLKHVAMIKDKTIDSGPSDCAGCNYTAAYIFKAESPGIDTVHLKLMQGSMDCDSNDITPERYIIEVK